MLDADPDTPRRLLHGRGHTLPGFEQVNVDWLPPVLLVSLFREATGISDDEAHVLGSRLGPHVPGCLGVAVQRRDGRKTQTRAVWGAVDEEHVICEAGLRYLVRPLANQNTGFFLDTAPLRDWLQAHACNANVLNLFAYTCSLSVAALAGGADKIVNVDMSGAALKWGQKNHALNDFTDKRVHMLPHNVFKSWWKIRQLGPFDIVLVDPPTNQRGSFVADKNYGAVLKRIPEFTKPGGRVIACLNSPFHNADFLPQLMARWCPDCALLSRHANSADFPDVDEDRGLKVYEFRYR